MPTCYHCGDEIEFRWIGGTLTPIHINGGWCSGGSRREPPYAQSSYKSVDSYLVPNARCPICRAPVFFYRSPYNGRVFFDDVGWPWPKHPCTDKYQDRDDQIPRMAKSRLLFHFRSRDGKSLSVYNLERVIERDGDLQLNLKNVERGPPITVVVSHSDLLLKTVMVSDIRDAPSLVLSRETEATNKVEVSFMSARLQSVVVVAGVLQGD